MNYQSSHLVCLFVSLRNFLFRNPCLRCLLWICSLHETCLFHRIAISFQGVRECLLFLICFSFFVFLGGVIYFALVFLFILAFFVRCLVVIIFSSFVSFAGCLFLLFSCFFGSLRVGPDGALYIYIFLASSNYWWCLG